MSLWPRYYLVAAGGTPGSPQLDTFGPNMSLASELLDRGETAAVIEYFKLCSNFWNGEFSQLTVWENDVRNGRRPRFGPNYFY